MRNVIFCCCLLAVFNMAQAQNILVDRGMRVNGLWCFPLVNDTSVYVYLPADARLSLNENKQPEFSFIRYVNSAAEAKANENTSIGHAGGGGVLHFLVLYETNSTQVSQAVEELRQRTGNRKAKINGPIVFKEGRYALISTIINPETQQQQKRLFAVGSAPVLEGGKIALSFSVDAKDSKLLLESFKSNTPDLSLVFDLSFSGLTDAYDAELTVNWDEVRKNMEIKGVLNVYVVSLQAQYAIDELFRKNVIKLKTSGSDAASEAMMTNIYNKLLNMLFERAPAEQSEMQNNATLTQAIGAVMGGSGSSAIGVNAGFKWRDIKTRGTSTINLNARSVSERHHYIVFNIGNFYSKYGEDGQFFKTVSLDDPDFQVRQVMIGIDGELAEEFEKLINNVTVTLKKEHDNGNETVGQVNLDRKNLQAGLQKYLSYGAIGDTSRMNWLNYQYKTSFQFLGGKSYETPWKQQADALINIYSPYQRKLVTVDGDAAILKEKKVRAVVVQVEYPFFGETRKTQLTVRPSDDFSTKKMEITLPLDKSDYKYKVTWMMSDGKTKDLSGTDNSGIIFIDNIPG
jgi:hypothetical protein